MGAGGRSLVSPSVSQRVEYAEGKFTLSGQPLTIKYSRRGVQIGCHFMTYEALDKIYKDSKWEGDKSE